MQSRINLKNIYAYVQAYTRKYTWKVLEWFHSKGLLKSTTLSNFLQIERFKYRVENASKTCLEQGKCTVCKCDTPELFLSDKGCEINCYDKNFNTNF